MDRSFSGHLRSNFRGVAACEIILILGVFSLYADWPAPAVNEPQYLGKAKHFWDHQWCPGDHFLESADVHWLFFATVGWLTRFYTLSTTAWIGRIVVWLALALAWRRLSWALVPQAWLAVVSAGLFVVGTHWFHMSGEWVIGGIEAKVIAYVFVLLGLSELVKDRWNHTWCYLGVASAFHVVVGGWSVLAAMLACCFLNQPMRPLLRSSVGGLVVGGLISLAGLIPALQMTRNVDPAVVSESTRIYVFDRLGHHLTLHAFQWHFIVRHLALLSVWMFFAWKSSNGRFLRLRSFILGVMTISLIGAVIDAVSFIDADFAARWLRYYFFRIGDVVLPLGASMLVIAGMHGAQERNGRLLTGYWLASGAAILVGLATATHYRSLDGRPGADRQSLPVGNSRQSMLDIYHDWLDVCRWVRESTRHDAIFVTPRYQQTFKWYCGRSEIVTWKDIPQNAADIVEWKNRIHDMNHFWRNFPSSYTDPQARKELVAAYVFHFLVVDRRRHPIQLPLSTRYANPSYAVIEVRDADGPSGMALRRKIESTCRCRSF